MTGRRFRQVIVSLCRGAARGDSRRRDGIYRRVGDATSGGTTIGDSSEATTLRYTVTAAGTSPSRRRTNTRRVAGAATWVASANRQAGDSPEAGHGSSMNNGLVKRAAGGTAGSGPANSRSGGHPTMAVVVEMAMTVTATAKNDDNAEDGVARSNSRLSFVLPATGNEETKM